MNVWKQLDDMKRKFENDMSGAEAAAKEYKFVALAALPHGEWTCRSATSAKHSTKLRAPNADELVAAMKRAFDAAEEASKAARQVPA